MPEIIERGYLYVPQPPLFRAVKRGEKARWFYTKKDLDAAKLNGWEISRFKGLGEMSAEQLWETSMNPETRILQRVTVKDAEKATEAVELCMGPKVPPRKDMIMSETFAA